MGDPGKIKTLYNFLSRKYFLILQLLHVPIVLSDFVVLLLYEQNFRFTDS